MAKKTKKAKATKRKTFRQQGVEAWEKYAAREGTSLQVERRAFLFAFEKGVKAHQSQRDHDGRPSEKKCKAAVKVLRQMRDARCATP